jgi:alpha-L-rhamnosidase
MRLVYVFLVGLMVGFMLSCARIEPVKVYQLTTSYLENPLGVDGSLPVLGWKIQTKDSGFTQIAYQVLVATSPELLNEKQANAWNSGRVLSDHSTNIVYSGIPLVSGQRYYWMVKVWGSIDTSAVISNTAWWETGLLAESDWQAQWISAVAKSDSVPPMLPSPYFRKEFTLDKNVRSARLYISGLGYHEAFINGQKVGDHVLDPMLTRYDKRVLYVTHDVTDLMKKGPNALGVVLGNGWYNQHTREAWDFDKAPWRDCPALLCQLKLELSDGSTLVVSSDSTWRFSTGPIVFNGVHNGETYDARLEIDGWNRPGFTEKLGNCSPCRRSKGETSSPDDASHTGCEKHQSGYIVEIERFGTHVRPGTEYNGLGQDKGEG